MLNSHGSHILVDYTNFFTSVVDIGQLLLSVMEQAIDNSDARRVHSHVEIFDGVTSPPGFAAVVLLDESHLTAHCYSDKGWLAIDCFTCGGTNAESIIDEIHQWLLTQSPQIKLEKRTTASRFLHGSE
jgi:S-adenosylmethionine decarboxylase